MKEKVEWVSVRKADPETQEQYWTRELVTVYKAEESDKINAVLDILKGVITAEDVREKYDIMSINSVYTWIGKYVSQEKMSGAMRIPLPGIIAAWLKDVV